MLKIDLENDNDKNKMNTIHIEIGCCPGSPTLTMDYLTNMLKTLQKI